jgi:subtilase family serine protease
MIALAAGCAAGGASAYPLTRNTPRVLLNRASPPTTAECEAALGIACYRPSQITAAYNLPALWAQGNEGQGQTIVIVDSFGSPTIQKDLKRFDESFAIAAPPSLKVIQPAGAVPPFEPSSVEMSGWAFETSLDVEYSHAMAPKASILLVETPEAETEGVAGFPPIVAAENYVIDHKLGQVISQSFGATEETFGNPKNLLPLRSAFENAALNGVTVLGASGDEGVAGETLNETFYHRQVNSWPSSDPLVTSVGGTQLHLTEEGKRTQPDNVWNDTLVGIPAEGGGGPSHIFLRPSYQYLLETGSGERRATPDISMSAAVNGGVLVYTSYVSTVPEEPAPNTFSVVGGTSEATPLFAGVVAIADQIAGHPLGQINPRMYQLALRPKGGGIVDITSGNNTFTDLNGKGKVLFTILGYEAQPGYDMASGLGTVNAMTFAHALAGH